MVIWLVVITNLEVENGAKIDLSWALVRTAVRWRD